MARSKTSAKKEAPKAKRRRAKKGDAARNGNGSAAVVGFEQKLWQAADKLRNNLDAAEYKHVVLGLIFLKYISDAFEEKHATLEAERESGADPEDRDEYRAENIFWVPKEARWSHLQGKAKQPTIGKLVDDAMVAIERDNPTLKGVLPKDYARPALDKQRLGELIDLIGTIGLGDNDQVCRPHPLRRYGRDREGQGGLSMTIPARNPATVAGTGIWPRIGLSWPDSPARNWRGTSSGPSGGVRATLSRFRMVRPIRWSRTAPSAETMAIGEPDPAAGGAWR